MTKEKKTLRTKLIYSHFTTTVVEQGHNYFFFILEKTIAQYASLFVRQEQFKEVNIYQTFFLKMTIKFEDAFVKDTTEALQNQSTRKKSKRKLSKTIKEKEELQLFFDDVSYTCGGTIQELDLSEKFSCVFAREHNCFDTVEKLCYSAGYDLICVHCASDTSELIETDYYSVSNLREEKAPVAERKKK